MSSELPLEQAIKRIAQAIAKRQATIEELDQQNMRVTQGDRSVIVKINQLYKSESDDEFR